MIWRSPGDLTRPNIESCRYFDLRNGIAVHLISSLIDIASSVVEDSEHGDQSVGDSVCPGDVATSSSDAVDVQTDSTSRFGNDGTLFQCFINAVDAVVLHRQQETATQIKFLLIFPLL